MFRNYFVITLRSFRKHQLYSFLNVLGLTLGLTVVFLIALFVKFEFSFDQFHSQADRIYRITQRQPGNLFLGSDEFAVTPGPLAEAMKAELAYVQDATLVGRLPGLVGTEDAGFYEDGLFTTSSFFKIFDFKLLSGDSENILDSPESAVVTSSFSKKLFGEDNPVGKRFAVKHFNTDYDLVVSGVVEDPPKNTHLDFGYLVSFAGNEEYLQKVWGSNNYLTYALVRPGTNLSAFKSDVQEIVVRNSMDYSWIETADDVPRYSPTPLADLHLNSRANFELGKMGDARYLWILVLAASVIMATACINYVNLATARAATRSKEVGLRKVSGATRIQIIKQFIGESVLTASVAALLAIGGTRLLLPVFNSLVDREIPRSLLLDGPFLIIILCVSVIVGVLSGAYPAFALSGMTPVRVLKSGGANRSHKSVLRNALVVSQFAIAIVLIVSTFIIRQQLNYISDSDTGLDREHVLAIAIRDGGVYERWDALKTELGAISGVESVASSSQMPTNIGATTRVDSWDGRTDDSSVALYNSSVSFGFVEMLGLNIVEGRSFSEDRQIDKGTGIIINETAKRRFGWDVAVGKQLDMGIGDAEVIGVVEDFQFYSSRLEILPLALYISDRWIRNVLVKVQSNDMSEAIEGVEQVMAGFSPKYPFEFQFLDDSYDALYRQEQRLSIVFSLITGLALTIACLGLFGLAAFMVLQRTKEIGVRKALGAGLNDIVLLLSRDFGRLVLVAFVIACPIAFFGMQEWLSSFAFRVEIGPLVFVLTGLLVLATALITVGYHSLKASLVDPVKALRYE